ncbi:MAG: LPXTG cell wall anchor domain-containing protein, partial [Egicoccus sp.]
TGELDFTVQDCDTTGGDSTDAVDKVEICHATAAPTNPYRMIEPAVEGVLHGHADQHTGPVFEDGMENGEWGDIIPAFSYVDDNGDVQQFEGQNWDALGQSVYDDGCAVGDLEAANPAISIDKSADVDTVTFTGDDDTVEVTYTYEITNTGNITLDLTELSDDKIADLDVSDLDDTTLDADESTAATQIVDLDVDDFDENGEHTNVVIVTGVIEGGDVTDTDDTVTGTDDETVTVDDGSEDDGGNGTPVVVQPDIEDGGPLRICVGTDAVLTLEAMFDDLDDSEDFDFTELELALDAGDLDLADYGLDADELVFDADGNVNVTLTDLPLGTHVIAYTVTLDGETVQSDDIEVRVTVCPPFPEIPVDGDEDGEDDGGTPVVDVPMIAVDYDVVCPEGVPGFTVNVTGTDLDTNDAEILVAYDAESAPYWSGDITLGDELALRWPVDADGLELDTFVFWVSVDGVTSDLVMVDNTDLECVLGEVIDQPDVDGNDEDAPVGGDDVIDDDEAVREDDEVVTNDDEDEVMGVVLDADEAGDADDAAAGSWLPRTGTSVLALLAAGLFSLLTGAGLLRRRS